MLPIIRWELSRRRWFMLWWSVGVSALIAMTVLSYLSFKGNVAQYNRDFSGLTSSAGSFFGGTDFFSPVGYLSSQIYYILLPILLIIMAVVLVSGLLGRDESDLTVELTLARPVSRLQLLSSKAIVALGVFAVVGAFSYVVTITCMKIAGLDIAWQHVLLTHVLCFAFAGAFGAISFCLMALSRLARPIANVCAIVLSFGGYVISSMGGYWDFFKQMAKLFPYHYYDTIALLNGRLSAGLLIYLIATFAICAVLASWGYQRRDIV